MAHIHELIDFVVNAFIIYEDKVLLIHHKKLKRWLSIGGHIELNEDPVQALFREIKEECGLEIELLGEKPPAISSQEHYFTPLHNPMYMDIHNVKDNHRHVALNYFAKAKSDKFVFNKEEHNDIRWFSKEDLDDPKFNVLPAIKFYATGALEAAKNQK